MAALFCLLLLSSAPSPKADLPVHCLRHQIAGAWKFFLGPSQADRPSCGHRRPDAEWSQPPSSLSSLGIAQASEKDIQLKLPDLVESGEGGGTWTMIYDEGFEVRTAGEVFFAFSQFDLWRDREGRKRNESHCDGTMLGWYHRLLDDTFGCYYATKLHATEALAQVLPFVTVAEKTQKSISYDMPLDSEWHKSIASKLNSRQLGKNSWTAQAYSKYNGWSMRDMNRRAGIQRSHVKHPYEKVSFFNTRIRASFHRSLASVEKKLPESFDWRDVAGVDYLEPVMDQGDCGSCYTVATMRMLTARHKIHMKDPDALPFSISFPLYCSEYNQGCDGGYAFLASKWSEDVGLVPATCARYTTKGRCEISAQCDRGERWRAAGHRYVGGYYGGSSAAQIMLELYHNGPLVVSLEPAGELMYYSGGVYKNQEASKLHQEWERVDHAVLLVGYGHDPETGLKYWTVQNSWGQDWGEDGFFRIARGVDDSGIESIAVAAEVVRDERNVDQFEVFVNSL